jgi:hypothetical protein
MTTPLTTLDDLRGESPCPLSWNELSGDDRVRHCGVCGRDVLNLSALSRAEAERAGSDPAVGCVRLLRRADGTPVTADPPGPRVRPGRLLASAAAGLVAAVTVGCADAGRPGQRAPDHEGCMQRDAQGQCVQWMGKR